MKHLLYLLTVVLFFAACSKDEDDEPISGENTYVLIRPDESFNLKAQHAGLTPTQIVQEAYSMDFRTHWGDNQYMENEVSSNRGFPDMYKDYENNILKFLSTDIIRRDGVMINDFLKSYDFFITNEEGDTIAYIPNDVLRTAEPLIEAAYEAEDFDEVYRLFNEAYTYRALE